MRSTFGRKGWGSGDFSEARPHHDDAPERHMRGFLIVAGRHRGNRPTVCDKPVLSSTSMLGFRTINLLIPGDPPSLELSTLEGPWTLEIETPFEPRRKAIVEEGKCQET